VQECSLPPPAATFKVTARTPLSFRAEALPQAVPQPRNLWTRSVQLARLGADAPHGPVGPFSLKTVRRTVFRALEPKVSSTEFIRSAAKDLRYARNDSGAGGRGARDSGPSSRTSGGQPAASPQPALGNGQAAAGQQSGSGQAGRADAVSPCAILPPDFGQVFGLTESLDEGRAVMAAEEGL
jgi:hypothetical protein